MTPEAFIQDLWEESADLKAAIPFARVITGGHDRLAEQELPCATLSVIGEQQRYATNQSVVWTVNVRLQCWARSIDKIVQIKNAVRDELHRQNWQGTGYVVSLSKVTNQYWLQEPDGEYQGIHEIELTYQLNPVEED